LISNHNTNYCLRNKVNSFGKYPGNIAEPKVIRGQAAYLTYSIWRLGVILLIGEHAVIAIIKYKW
jgi:hypothetical protein